jgi:hypothetical protein
MRLLAVLLIVGLAALSAYAGCRQLHAVPPGQHPPDHIKAVDTIHAYIQRVERAFHLTDDTSPGADPAD